MVIVPVVVYTVTAFVALRMSAWLYQRFSPPHVMVVVRKGIRREGIAPKLLLTMDREWDCGIHGRRELNGIHVWGGHGMGYMVVGSGNTRIGFRVGWGRGVGYMVGGGRGAYEWNSGLCGGRSMGVGYRVGVGQSQMLCTSFKCPFTMHYFT